MANFHHTETFTTAGAKTGKVYIWLTRYGVLYFLVLLVMLLGALNYKNNMGLLLTFLLAGMALISLFTTHRTLSSLRPGRLFVNSAFSGDPLSVALEAESRSSAVPSFNILINGVAGAGSLEPSANEVFTLSLPTEKRGLVPLDRVRVETAYPLGLFRSWRTFHFDGALGLVYPSPQPGPMPLSQQAGQGDDGGAASTRGAEDFSGHRQYQPGDPLRHIDWRVYSRGQGLFSKQFEAPTSSEMLLSWERLPEGDPEHRLSIMCHAILKAHRDQWRFGVDLPWARVAPDSGARHVHGCLSQLSRMGNGSRP
jgi:uncharacterized protein (DUF58 family)